MQIIIIIKTRYTKYVYQLGFIFCIYVQNMQLGLVCLQWQLEYLLACPLGTTVGSVPPGQHPKALQQGFNHLWQSNQQHYLRCRSW